MIIIRTKPCISSVLSGFPQPQPMLSIRSHLRPEGVYPPTIGKSAEESCPWGLRLGRDGTLLGSPVEEGEYDFNVSVQEGLGTTDSRSFHLDVAEAFEPVPIPELKLLTSALAPAVVDHEYPLIPSATGGVPPYNWSILGDKPVWLRELRSRGWHGQPQDVHLGSHKVLLVVEDAEGNSARSDSLDLEVLVASTLLPEPLELLTADVAHATQGERYTFAFSARGGHPPYIWESEGLTQQSITLDRDTGVLHGLPHLPAKLPLRVSVRDQESSRVAQNYLLEIDAPVLPLELRTGHVPVALAGSHFAQDLSASGGHPPYRWSLESGELPTGLAIDTLSSRLQGTPEQPGLYHYSLAVSDAHGERAVSAEPIQQNILTQKLADKLELLTHEVPLLVNHRSMSLALSSQGGTPPYVYHIDGEMPEGLHLNGNQLSGVPTQSGRFDVQLQVRDAEGQQDQADIELHVEWLFPWLWMLATLLLGLLLLVAAWYLLRVSRQRPPLMPLKILTEEVPNARASAPYSVQLACSGGCMPYRWRLVSGELPPGLTLTEDGLLSGVPFKKDPVSKTVEMGFCVEVRDERGATDRKDL